MYGPRLKSSIVMSVIQQLAPTTYSPSRPVAASVDEVLTSIKTLHPY
jgi:hypothetical protein